MTAKVVFRFVCVWNMSYLGVSGLGRYGKGVWRFDFLYEGWIAVHTPCHQAFVVWVVQI